MKPFFSIGVTTYNRPQMLKQNLLSILDQEFEDIEVVVCNDYVEEKVSSTTIGICDPRVKIVNNSENVGPLANHNLVLQRCNGRYFTWLADDDMFSKGTLLAIHDALIKYDYPKCVYTSYRSGSEFENRECQYSGSSKILAGRDFVRSYLNRELAVVGNYGFFDTKWLRELGGMKKLGTGTFSPYSDNLLAVMTVQLRRIVYLDAKFILYRLHSGSPSHASKDVKVFRTAQADFLKYSLEILEKESVDEYIEENMLKIIEWCQQDIRSVASRSGRIQIGELLKHTIMIWKYFSLMKKEKNRLRYTIFPWLFFALIENVKRTIMV